MPNTDLLALDQLDADLIGSVAIRAIELANHWANRTMPKSLEGKRIGLIADLPGWRNPTALALGVAEMGAVCIPVTASLDGREPIEDLAGYLDNWFDCLAIRTPSLKKLSEMATLLDAPVINLRTNDNHPCETFGDLAFALKMRRSWNGMRVVVVAPAGNILQSWIEAAKVLPIYVEQISHPSLFATIDPMNGRFTCSESLASLNEADLIITDCWPSDVHGALKAHLGTLRITAAVLDRCRPDLMFIPCPPVTRGQEVSSDAMAHSTCVVNEAKAYLLHIQNAFLEYSLGGRK